MTMTAWPTTPRLAPTINSDTQPIIGVGYRTDEPKSSEYVNRHHRQRLWAQALAAESKIALPPVRKGSAMTSPHQPDHLSPPPAPIHPPVQAVVTGCGR